MLGKDGRFAAFFTMGKIPIKHFHFELCLKQDIFE
jgi:hypothetical protein